MAPPAALAKLEKAMRDRAMSYPHAEEAFPWGERAIKVKGKTFLFMRLSDAELSFSVKLPRTGVQALALPFAKPTEYGLGKHGWVTVRLAKTSKELSSQCLAWIDESYRGVAPKKVVQALDATKPAETSKKRRA
jgi:predicted DNA-binding protein (MmcQ/YjbR family)